MRVKIGIGEKPKGWDLADHVLGRFDAAERESVETAIGDAVAAAELVLSGEIDAAMNEFNGKKQEG